MDLAILLIGPSGGGKTSLAFELKDRYNIILSHTTRRPRSPDEWGHTFSKVEDYERDLANENVAAHVFMYGEHYWATKCQFKGKGTSIYIVDPEGAADFVRKNPDFARKIVFLYCDEANRIARMRDSDRKFTLEDIWYRIKRDRELFATCKVDYFLNANSEFPEVVEKLISIIESESD